MDKEQTINILLVNDNVEDANRLVSLLRNANYNLVPQYAANADEFSKRIQERNWELALVQFSATSVPARSVVHQIRRLNKDIPVVFILNEYNPGEIVDSLKMGAADAVPIDEDQLFIQVVARTLDNLDQRRKLRYWQRRFSESEDRFENLILSSQDAIAIVQEGTYVHVNNTYASYFGYADADSMVLMPVFDTIADDSQKSFKKYLKPLDANDAWDTEVIRFEGITTEEKIVPTQATLSQIDFHGEPALQLLIKKEYIANRGKEVLAESASPTSAQTDVTKIRLQELVESINSIIRRSAKSGEDALLFYFAVDNYHQTQRRLGIGLTESGLSQLAFFIDGLVPERATFGRIREEAFITIIATNDAEKGIALGERIVREVASQIFNTTEGSFTCTLSIGITPIGEATPSADEALSDCQKIIADLQKTDASGRFGNAVKFHEPVFDLAAQKLSEADILRLGRQLIKKDLITLAFQPIISLQGSHDETYEVLMRVDVDAFSEAEISSDFVATLFRTEIGRDLDRLIISEVLEKLYEKKKTAPHTKLFINLSPASIADEMFVPWLHKKIEELKLASGDLVFQMREMDITNDLGAAVRVIERLKNLGASTCLTHYGLSINPATIFSRIHVDYVKVDGAISGKSQKDKSSLETLKTLLAELRDLKRHVVVPFIESASIIPTLWQSGVEFLQGHYIQPPEEEMNFDFSEE